MSSEKKAFGRRFLVVLGLLGLVGAGALYFLSPKDAPPQLVTTKAQKMDLRETVLASGTLEAVKMVSVGAQASGQIKSLKVALGDKVQKDQLVAEIDSLNQQNDLKTSEANLQNMRAQLLAKEATLKQAKTAFDRQSVLIKQDAVSTESYQLAEASFATAGADVAALNAQITQAEIAVDTARVNLGYTQIAAPMDGTVVAIVAEEGQTVNASQTAPTIIKLAQLDNMTIKAEISEADITRVKVGQKVTFTIMGEPDRQYEATLRSIEPAPDSISTDTTSSTSSSSTSSSSTSTAIYYNGLFDVPNPEGKLRISMTAEINIILDEAKDALAIPRSALGKAEPDGSYKVRVLDEQGRPVTKIIHVGLSDNVHMQVTDGLREGDEVVVGDAAAAKATSAGKSSRQGPPPMGL